MERHDDLTAAERRKRRQRDHIIEEAIRLFHEKGGEEGGFEATTVDEIAARADISVRTFFRYFESKQDVIYLDYRRAVADLLEFVNRRLQDEPPEQAALHGSLDQVSTFTASAINRQRIVRALRSSNFEDRRAIWQQNARNTLAKGLLPYLTERDDPMRDAGIIAMLVRSVVDEGMMRWSNDPHGDPAAYILDSVNSAKMIVRLLPSAN